LSSKTTAIMAAFIGRARATMAMQPTLVGRTLAISGAGRAMTSWSTCDPNAEHVGRVLNLLQGKWVDGSGADASSSASMTSVPDPMTGKPMVDVSEVSASSGKVMAAFAGSIRACPKSGLHNPIKRPERYLAYGDISLKVAAALREDAVAEYFASLIARVAPKSKGQAMGEVVVTRKFFENFAGDNVRYLAKSFTAPGDYQGQRTEGLRWPFGGVAIVTPFNFPLEIPALQLMGALYMGNKPVIKTDTKVSVVVAELLRLLHHCGMPAEDCDFINCGGETMGELIRMAEPRNTLFTGSSKVAESLARELGGKIFVEDAGFDWKIMGPDVPEDEKTVRHVAWKADQDAYAFSGQKCSAQSMLFVHDNWNDPAKVPIGQAKGRVFEEMLADRASKRKLADLTVGPVLTVTNERIERHIAGLLELDERVEVLFGGRRLAPEVNHTIPDCYGSFQPTAVFVPLDVMLRDDESFRRVTTEIFGPFQVVTRYSDDQIPMVLDACERMNQHLTAAVVSNDVHFRNKVLAHTVNGTTYAGMGARTTGAPQNHWFGPAGDPRGAGIGSQEAIKLVWSCHREIVYDEGPVPSDAQLTTT